MKRFFTYFLAFTVSLSVFSVYFYDTAKAASPYDNVVETVNNLTLTNNSNSLNCFADDQFNLRWTEFFETNTYENGYTYGDVTVDVTRNGSSTLTLSQIQDAWNAREWWTVTQRTNYNPGDLGKSIVVSFVTDASKELSFYTLFGSDFLGVEPYTNLFEIEIMLQSNSTCNINVNMNGGSVGLYPAQVIYNYSNTNKASPLFAYWPINYPDDYEGQIPPEVTPGGNVYRPEIGYYTTTDNFIKALLTDGTSNDVCIPVGLDEITGCVAPLLRWTVFAANGTTVLNTVTQQSRQPYEFKLPGNDTYYLQAEFVHPGAPIAPFSSDITLQITRVQINANGTFLTGGTGANDCSVVDGVYTCEPASPLEDCSTYGTDFGGYFQCVINNFGIWLRSTLTDLFVPKYSFFQSWTSDFGQFLNSKLGFLYTSFSTITTLFGGIITNGATGTCAVDPPGDLFGAPVSFDVCLFEESFGSTIWGIMQGVVISLTILALVFAGYRKYLEVVDHR